MKSRQLRATGTRFFACSLAVVAVVAALSFCGPQGRLHAQQPPPPPPWPSTRTDRPYHCVSSPNACDLCVSPQQTVGCTSGIPYPWILGSCILVAQGNCDTSTFDCSAELICATVMPNGQFCYQGPICQ